MQQQSINTTPGGTKKEKGIISSVFGGISDWFRNLLGRTKPVQLQAAGVQSQVPGASEAVSEDSVKEDIQKLKRFMGKVTTQVSLSVAPAVSKGKVSGTSSVGQVVDTSFLKKIIRIFLVIFFLMIVAYIGIRLFRELGKNVENVITGDGTTPTPIQYQPYKPSVYAEDPVTLKLEEDINVLERELAGTNLRETLLNPPTIDFDVSF